MRCCKMYTASILLVTARAGPTITVDDGDPSIEYHGAWTHNPWGNQSVNYGSSVTFTNASGSTATYKFQGESGREGFEESINKSNPPLQEQR